MVDRTSFIDGLVEWIDEWRESHSLPNEGKFTQSQLELFVSELQDEICRRIPDFTENTVGKNAKKIEEYVRNQLQEDLEYDQMSLKEYIDPFTGEPVNKA